MNSLHTYVLPGNPHCATISEHICYESTVEIHDKLHRDAACFYSSRDTFLT